jgi:hypothetical protein
MSRAFFFGLAIALLCACSCGCVGLRPEAQATEAAWQALNVVDAGETVTIAREPGLYHEADPLGRLELGEHPTTGRVYAVMAAEGVAHLIITRWLDHEDHGTGAWHAASIAWQAVTLGWKGYDVGHNAAIGIEPWLGAEPRPTFTRRIR